MELTTNAPAEGEVIAPPLPIENVTTSQTPIAATAATTEKINEAGKSIFASAGEFFRRGRGRPRKDGLPAKGDQPIDGTVPGIGKALSSTAGAATDDTKVIKKCVAAIFKSLTDVLGKILYTKAVQKTRDKNLAAELVKTCEPTPDETDGFTELATICLKKYGVGTQYAPEVGAVVILGGISMRYVHAIKSLNAEPDSQQELPLQ